MKTRTSIILTAGAFAAAAVYAENFAGFLIAIFGSAIFWQGHCIEVKLNKLLDEHRLVVTSDDLNN